MTTVLGVDGDKRGWVGVVLSDGVFVAAHLAPTLDVLVEECGSVEVIAIDMPIGWCEGTRAADGLARGRLKSKASSVFSAPPAEVRDATSYAEANERARAATGKGMSAQSWALVPKIIEVVDFADRCATRVVEAHPELSFAVMDGGRPILESKRTWAGQRYRLDRLRSVGIILPDDLGSAGLAGAEDVIDAAVVAWTAARVAGGASECLPAECETDVDGRQVAIWV